VETNKSDCVSPPLVFGRARSQSRETSGLYYKHVTIVNCASSGVNMLKASLNDARVVIYDCRMFIVQATDWAIFYYLS
jgi:hypothetical protein